MKEEEYHNIYKDILDVEGFQVDDDKSWKYVMIIAFFSTDLIILNRNPRFDEVKKIIGIIQNSLKKMQEMNIPRILKRIFIQTISEHKKPIEELLKNFNYDKNIFQTIKFQYIYLPNIQLSGNKNELIKYPEYKKNFIKIINLLNETNNYNSASSLRNYIDAFNQAVNGNSLFKSQKILSDIELDFYGVYKKHEKKLKDELIKKIPYLKKLDNVDETFKEFIEKQDGLNFKFDIKNEDFTFYGSSSAYNNIYENFKKKKTFKVDPKEIFLDSYNTQKLELIIKANDEKQKIFDIYLEKKANLNNYFALLKFYQEIDKNMDLTINLETNLIEYKLERENDLKEYFKRKMKEKEKEWQDQIERAKWKAPVQAYGKLECENGHKLTEDVFCGKCHQNLYWVDSDERYVICKGCNRVRKMTDNLYCSGCGAKSLSNVKWISGYKP